MSKIKDTMIKAIINLFLLCCSILMVAPFLYMISSSFKKSIDIFQFPIRWIPPYWFPDNFIHVLTRGNSVLQMYFNSAKITVINTIGAALTSSLAAYAYAKMKFKGRDILFLIMVSTVMIPAQVTYVPKFILFTSLNMMNTHLALILPGLCAVFGTFMIRQFFMQIPDALIESAVIDGAGDLRIWWQIALPIAKPAIATFFITAFNNFWNDYESPLIFLRNRNLFTLPLGIVDYSDDSGRQYQYIMALTTISILPLIIVFMAGQKYFLKGFIAGAIKG